MEKSRRKCAPKASPRPLFNFGKLPKTANACNNRYVDISKENYQKALKRSTLLFLLKPIPFNAQSYQKQKGPGTSDQLLLRLQNKFRKIPFLIIHYLTKFNDVI